MDSLQKYLCASVFLTFVSGFSVAQFAFAADEAESTGHLVTSLTNPNPHAFVNLGFGNHSNQLKAKFVLTNTTDQEIAFDNILKVCSCTNITPSKGIIPAGGKISITLEIGTSVVGELGKTTGMLEFRSGSTLAFTVDYTYEAKGYSAFLGNLAFLALDDEFSSDVQLPMAISSDLKAEDLEFSLNGIKGTLEGSVREQKVFVGKLKVDSQDLPSRSYGSIEVFNVVSSSVSVIPVIVERQAPIRLLPSELRFTRMKDSSDYQARAFIKVSDQKVDVNSPITVNATFNDRPIHAVAKKLGRLSQLNLVVTERDFLKESVASNDGLANEKLNHKRINQELKLWVEIDHVRTELLVPTYFEKYEK